MMTYQVVSNDMTSKKILVLENFRTPMPATSGSSVIIFDPFTAAISPFEPRVTLQTMEKTIEIEKGF